MLTWSNTIPIFAVAVIEMSGVATVVVVLSVWSHVHVGW